MSYDAQSIASGKDFDEKTGAVKGSKHWSCKRMSTPSPSGSRSSRFALLTSTRRFRSGGRILLHDLYTPAGGKPQLGFGASRTMEIAQRLYRRTHYVWRTDSFNLAEGAIAGIRTMVEKRYGAELVRQSLVDSARAPRGAGSARGHSSRWDHDATASELGLSGPEAKLYDLIWKRTVSTQMADARIAMTTARIEAIDPKNQAKVLFRSSGRQVVFPGFFRAYVEGTDDPEAVLEHKDQPLPKLEIGDSPGCRELEALGHETRPPARYTVATLVKALETKGIGRPSTYASIIDTIQRRGYVRNERQQLIPTFTAMAVTKLLEQTLGRVMDIEFTASMEAWLDEIALGGDALEYLESFYNAELMGGLREGEQINARSVCTLSTERISPYRIRLGRWPFVGYDIEGRNRGWSLFLKTLHRLMSI